MILNLNIFYKPCQKKKHSHFKPMKPKLKSQNPTYLESYCFLKIILTSLNTIFKNKIVD